MTQRDKLIARILSGRSDANIDFDELCGLLRWLGFRERISGSHHSFSKAGVADRITLQPTKNGKAKAYQVDQVRDTLTAYGLV